MISLLALAVYVAKGCGVAVFLTLIHGVAWLVNMLLIAPLSDPLRRLPGPPGSRFQNHFREIMDPDMSPGTHVEWVKEYGKNFRFHGFGAHDLRMMCLDFRSISHILNSPVYEKPWQTRRFLSRLLGRGIFAMEGVEHKIQRKLIGPAFTSQAVKALSSIFFQQAEELSNHWDALLSCSSASSCNSSISTSLPVYEHSSDLTAPSVIIDVCHWLSRATFDIIGLTGFDYAFHALRDESEDIYLAYRRMFAVADKKPGIMSTIRLFFPILDTIYPDEGVRVVRECQKIIRNAGAKLITDKKAAIMAEQFNAKEIKEKDILSLLIKSNLSEDPTQRMTDHELLDQLSTFLFAGSDSTSLAVSSALNFLSLYPAIQQQLRAELVTSRIPLNDTNIIPVIRESDVDVLPLLDAVVRETLRLAPPVHGTIRVATRNDIIPISEPITLRDGTLAVEGIKIRKGSYVHVPIEGFNLSKDTWGTDAREFKPERWFDLPPSARALPGLANLMTFSFGPHACPGFRFTIFEVKVFLAVLLPHFAFAPVTEIRKYNGILTRPYVCDRFELGTMLPLRVSRCEDREV